MGNITDQDYSALRVLLTSLIAYTNRNSTHITLYNVCFAMKEGDHDSMLVKTDPELERRDNSVIANVTCEIKYDDQTQEEDMFIKLRIVTKYKSIALPTLEHILCARATVDHMASNVLELGLAGACDLHVYGTPRIVVRYDDGPARIEHDGTMSLFPPQGTLYGNTDYQEEELMVQLYPLIAYNNRNSTVVTLYNICFAMRNGDHDSMLVKTDPDLERRDDYLIANVTCKIKYDDQTKEEDRLITLLVIEKDKSPIHPVVQDVFVARASVAHMSRSILFVGRCNLMICGTPTIIIEEDEGQTRVEYDGTVVPHEGLDTLPNYRTGNKLGLNNGKGVVLYDHKPGPSDKELDYAYGFHQNFDEVSALEVSCTCMFELLGNNKVVTLYNVCFASKKEKHIHMDSKYVMERNYNRMVVNYIYTIKYSDETNEENMFTTWLLAPRDKSVSPMIQAALAESAVYPVR